MLAVTYKLIDDYGTKGVGMTLTDVWTYDAQGKQHFVNLQNAGDFIDLTKADIPSLCRSVHGGLLRGLIFDKGLITTMQQEVPEGIADRLRSEMAFTKNPHDATRPVRTTIFQPEPGLQVAMAMVPEAPHAPAHVIPEAPEEPGAAPVAEVGPASAIGGGEGQEEGSDQGPEITTAEGQSVSWKDGRDYETQKSMVVNSDDPAFLQAVIDDPEEGAQFKKLARFRLKNLPGKD